VLAQDGGTRLVRDVDGILKREFIQYGTSSMPQFLEFPVKGRADFVKLLPRLDPHAPGRLSPDWDRLRRFYAGRDFPVGLTVCGAFGHPRNLLGVENLCLAYYEQPALVHEIMEQWAEFYCALAARVWEGVQYDFVLIWEDMAYKGGSLISPRLVKEFMLPYYRRLIERVRGLGCDLIIVDSDGDVTELVPLFLSAGVNVILPFEVQAGMDVRQFRKQYGTNLAMIGGLDKRLLVQAGPALEQEIREKALPLLASGGYIPALDHTVPPNVSLENFRAYLACLRGIV
jgi:uroporphyrinogen decarboxylase